MASTEIVGSKLPNINDGGTSNVHQTFPLSIREAVDGKNILVTGGTGFLGKVLIEKLLRSTDVNIIYILIRPRKGSTAQARMQEEIVQSLIFDRLKKEIGVDGFFNMANKKLVAVGGDVTHIQVGLSAKDLEMLRTSVNHIIHCAANVDFNERLDRAVELNVYGSLRLMEIAQKFTDLHSFLHVSTCYVNSNRRGQVGEKMYPLGFDPEVVLKKIQGLSQSELQKDQLTSTGLLREWPNTYTFTKAMTEPMLIAKRGTVPLAIVRPSIIGASWREPCPGWVDVVSAAGAVYITAGLGVINFLPGDGNSVADIVPVDYVVNVMLAALPAVQKQNTHMIFQAASSMERPLRWDVPIQVLAQWFRQHQPEQALSPAKFRFISSPQEYQIQFFLRYSVPSSVLGYLSQLGTQKHKNTAAQFSKLVWKVRVLTESFKHFVENEWRFDNDEVRSVFHRLPIAEQNVFPMELATLDWPQYTINFGYGLSKYILKGDMIPVSEIPDTTRFKYLKLPGTMDPEFLLDNKNLYNRVFPNVAWAQHKWSEMEKLDFPQHRRLQDMYKIVLESEGVRKAIREEVDQKLHDSRTQEQAELRARRIVEKMFGDKEAAVLTGMGVTLRKIWKRIYETIKVDIKYCEQIREIAKTCPIVFIPTHRSYIDFLVVSYVTFACQLPIPFIAAGEDFLGILLVRSFFRKSGAFFLRRSFLAGEDALYSAIFKEYVTQLLVDGQCLEFFIEGTRSRSGKMLQPKLGLLSIVTNVFFDGKVKDLTFVPMSINYEKTMEGDMYSSELMGDNKIKESLRSLLRSLGSVLSVNFGEISVVLNEPISLKAYTDALVTRMRTSSPLPTITFNPQDGYRQAASETDRRIGETEQGKLVVVEGKDKTNKQPDTKKSTKTSEKPSSSAIVSPASLTSPSDAKKPTEKRSAISSSTISSTTKSSSTTTNTAVGSTNTAVAPAFSGRNFDPWGNATDRRTVNRLLSYKIVHSLNSTSQCMPTHLMATLMLMYRHGITKTQLVEKMEWLHDEIVRRGGNVELFEREYKHRLADHPISHLRHLITEPRKDFYEPAISLKGDYPNMLALGHYRNKILHLFFREGLWACALYSFNETTDIHEHGVDRQVLQKEVAFLHEMLQLEFIWKEHPDEPEDFDLALIQLVQRGILKITADNLVEVAPTGEGMFSFLCALFWPFIDSYFVAAMTLASLQPSLEMEQSILLQRTQWLATTLYHESMLCFYESCSLETLSNALQTLARWKVVAITKAPPSAPTSFGGVVKKKSGDKFIVSLLPPYNTDEALQDLVSRIGRLRKQPLARKSLLRRNLIADIPILAKL